LLVVYIVITDTWSVPSEAEIEFWYSVG